MSSTPQFGTRRNRHHYTVARARSIAATVTAMSVTAGGIGALIGRDASQATIVSGNYEVATIADTAYAIPAGAIFVATNGSDTNLGTQASPFATISKAVSAATSGATIVVRGGTYRETLGSIFKRITLQPYPHEMVWLKGSVVVSGFASSGNGWVKGGWNPTNVCNNCFPSTMIDPNFPAAGHADQVFIDGAPQSQVLSKASLAAGNFYVDRATDELWLGTNPAGHTVESTVEDKAAQFNTSGAAGSIVRGIGIAHYAGHYNMDVPAAMVANTPDITFDNNTFAWNAGRGLSMLYPGAVATNNLVIYNGINGVHANNADGLVFTGNRIAFNNIEHYLHTPGSAASIAGFKITSTADATIKDNLIEGNDSNGLWFDVSSYNNTITNNAVLNNDGHGIYYEVSTKAVIASNLSVGNSSDGIKVSGSTNVDVWNNTSIGNVKAQIGIYDDGRVNTNQAEIAIGITFDTKNVTLANNIVIGDAKATKPLLLSMDASSPKHLTSAQMIALNDRNLWGRPTATVPSYAMQWQLTTAQSKSYSSLAAMQLATGRENTSTSADNVALSTIFVDAANGDYRLAAGSPGLATGASLPANVRAAMKVSGSVHLGAYSWPVSNVGNGGGGTTTTTAPPTTTTAPPTTTTTAPPTTTTTAPPVNNTALTAPVYALRNAATGDRIYTTDTSERDSLVTAGYTDNGVAFQAATVGSSSTTAVYRLRSTKGAHLYTTTTNERDKVIALGWTLEGTAFYGARKPATGLTPVWRLYDSSTRDHYLSTDSTVATGSKPEAIFFYAAP